MSGGNFFNCIKGNTKLRWQVTIQNINRIYLKKKSHKVMRQMSPLNVNFASLVDLWTVSQTQSRMRRGGAHARGKRNLTDLWSGRNLTAKQHTHLLQKLWLCAAHSPKRKLLLHFLKEQRLGPFMQIKFCYYTKNVQYVFHFHDIKGFCIQKKLIVKYTT